MAWTFYNTDGSAKQRLGTVPGINDLGDVVIVTAAANQALQYDGTNWLNVTNLFIVDAAIRRSWFYGAGS